MPKPLAETSTHEQNKLCLSENSNITMVT